MENRIKPKFDSFDVRTTWDESTHRWAKELAVFIINEMEPATKLPLGIDKRSVGEEFYIIVCSPEFRRNPNDQVSTEDLKKAIVLEVYSESEVEKSLRGKIDPLGEVTLVEFESKMAQMFDMTDWFGNDE